MTRQRRESVGWTGQSADHVHPRLALQLIHEAALCVTGARHTRSLNQKGLELASGLPFVATDQAIHDLLEAHTVAHVPTANALANAPHCLINSPQ